MEMISLSDKRREDLVNIAAWHGWEHQAEKAIEEMAELIAAIKHVKKKDEDAAVHEENYFEELADVSVMVIQLFNFLNGVERKKVNDIINFKIEREIKRIKARQC